MTRKMVCHATGEKCLGCKHYQGQADVCDFAPAPQCEVQTDKLTPEQVYLINDMIHAWIDQEKKGEFRQAFRNDCKQLLATSTRAVAQAQTGCDTDHIDWDKMAEERLGQSPIEHGRHIPQTSPAPGCDSGSHSAQASWMPIGTAPMDGTEIIGVFHRRYDEDSPATVYGPWTVAWDGRKWRSSWDGSEVISSESDFGTEYKGPDIDPTHWMPLPGVSIPSASRGTEA